jgi:hypothetical protein
MKNKKTMLMLMAAFLGMAVLSYGRVPDQPHMNAALSYLQTAKNELKVAEHNKGGHRANAVGLVNRAITEVNRGIQYARSHNNHAVPSGAGRNQPHMQAALDALNNAKSELDQATADKGGHRANAISLVNQAIDEVTKGIAAGT